MHFNCIGEYILYKDGVIFGGIYDNRFLIKKTKSLVDSGLKEQIPYPNAKPMLLVDSKDPDVIKQLVVIVVRDNLLITSSKTENLLTRKK